MMEQEKYQVTVPEAILAKEIGQKVLDFIKDQDMQVLTQRINGKALELLEKIRDILDDEKLDDPECFERIETMVDAFQEAGISVSRHDW